jgi:FkbM family methyltransferase
VGQRTPRVLIYDVGMHNGDDTAFYLHQGHSVVAIEAIEELAELACARFHKEIAAGRLVVLNVAIGPETGVGPFWICDEATIWSSSNRAIASRDHMRHHRVELRTCRFADVLAQYGVPHYLKVDIEGSDHLCLKDLSGYPPLPPYVSVETECGGSEVPLTETEYLYTLRLLQDSGYTKFKLVHQESLVPVRVDNFQQMLEDDYRARIRTQIEAKAGWRFAFGASGPWGEDIVGGWMEYSEALEVVGRCRKMFFEMFQPELYAFWFDWHARAKFASIPSTEKGALPSR